MSVPHKERDFKYKLRRDLRAHKQLGPRFAPLLNVPLLESKYSYLAREVFSEELPKTHASEKPFSGETGDGKVKARKINAGYAKLQQKQEEIKDETASLESLRQWLEEIAKKPRSRF